MTQETIIRKLVDEILLNTSIANISGFYNGEAGISLALFEASKFLHDETIEEKAFDIFKRSLVKPSDDYSFENGLSGIGYTLSYLITNKFIDADFDEIFNDRYNEIIKNFENIDSQPDKLLGSYKIIYFLSTLNKIRYEDERIKLIIEKIFQGVGLYLSLQFFDWQNICYINNKVDVLRTFETYLKLIDFSSYSYFSKSLIDSYARLYREGRIASSLSIGYYMHRIMTQNNITEYNDVIKNNIKYGLTNIHPDLLFLEEKINIKRIVENISGNFKIAQTLADIKLLGISLEKIKKMIRPGRPLCDYQYGLARYLIFCVNKNTPLL